MDLNSGYKQTEIGVIPKDWKQTKIRGIASTVRNAIVGGPFGSDLISLDYVDDGVPVIRGQNMSSRWISGNFVFVSPAKAKSLEANLAHPGDLVFTQRGSLGQVSLVPEAPFDRYLVSQSQMKLSVNRAIADPLFFYFVFTSEDQQKLIRQGTIQTGVPHINLGILRDLPVQLPPLAEQEGIAEALSDADALIESLEQLIGKRRRLKQGAMQQLLTGNKRLPGFTGKWETQTLEQLEKARLIRLSRGNVISKKDIERVPGDFPIYSSSVKSEGVFGRYGEFMFDEELITWSVDGGGHFFHRPRHRFSVTNVCGYMRVETSKLRYQFLAAQLQLLHSRLKFDYQDKAHPSVIRKAYSVSFPSLDEQTAIAEILSDMDAQIAALEAKLSKCRQLKQGMMHNLLKGKIRLVDPALARVKPTAAASEQSVATPTRSGSHTWAFNEAVIISVLADQFGKPEFPLGRKRRTKLSYLFHRKTDQEVQGYLKKAAGPYNPRAKYAGPEKIAQENGYVRNHQSGKFNGFIAAENIAQAKAYFAKWYEPKNTAWLEQFRFKSNDELECLATVDMAMQELLKQNKTTDVESVRALIVSEPEWIPKLKRSAFSDAGITEAIAKCSALFG